MTTDPLVSPRLPADGQARSAFDALMTHFWNDDHGLFAIRVPMAPAGYDLAYDPLHYWWQAHALDSLVDAFLRDGQTLHLEQAARLLATVQHHNGGLTNDYYDDMEWLALACLRASDAGGGAVFRDAALTLWADIQGGWNSHCGGGVAWRKTQLDYKNTPANAPAAILATRLYRRFGNPDDLAWAVRIFAWLEAHLIDPQSSFVWDGLNRLGDGQIDRDWDYTYCQGVTLGAALELWHATGEAAYLTRARHTAQAALRHWPADPPDEGIGDAGLFKGILARYLAELERDDPNPPRRSWLEAAAATAWGCRDPTTGLSGTSWTAPPQFPLDLSAALSGVMLFETLAALNRAPGAPGAGRLGQAETPT